MKRHALAVIVIVAAHAGAWVFAQDKTTIEIRDANAQSFSPRLDGIEISSTSTPHDDHVAIDGFVKNVRGGERCVDLKLCVPIDCRGWRFGLGLNEEKSIDREVAGTERGGCAMYPLATISGEKDGMTLAVPPASPTRFSTGADSAGVWIIFRVGLSADSNPANETAFHAVMFHHDPAWGFRSALAKYYEIFREPWFTRFAKHIGVWTSVTASHRGAPELVEYHEAGFPTWRTPGGTESGINIKETDKLLDEGPICNSVQEFEKLCELEADEKAGVYSLPYTIVGQRQMLQLPSLPQTYDDAMNVLKTWSTTQPILFDGPPQALSFRSAEELKKIIRNSALYDEHDRLTFVARKYRGPTLTFPTNPSPNLFRDTDQPTVAKYELDYYVPQMLGSKFVDGVYVDSLGRWCGFDNFRREHFKYSSLPLTYGGDPPRPCIWNLQSHAEYLAELSKRLHGQGKIVLANGVHPDRVMLGAFVDVMGCEGTPTYDAGGFESLRVAAGRKPYCYLNAASKSSPRLWASCLYVGYLLNANKDPAMMRKFDPIIIRLNEAGWQPVTHARASPEQIGIERFGERMFTVMNRSKKPIDATIAIDTPNGGSATELISRNDVPTTKDGDKLTLKLPLAAEQAVAIEVK